MKQCATMTMSQLSPHLPQKTVAAPSFQPNKQSSTSFRTKLTILILILANLALCTSASSHPFGKIDGVARGGISKRDENAVLDTNNNLVDIVGVRRRIRKSSSWKSIGRGGGCFIQRKKSSSSSSENPAIITETKKSSSLSIIRRRLVLLLVSSALFNDMLQLTMLLPIIPTLLSSPPPLGVESNAEIAMGIFFASKDIFQLTTAPLAGVLTARTSSTVALLSSTIGLGLATLVFADASTFKELLVARSCQGAASAATLCGGLSLVSETFPAAVRGSAMGTAYTGLALGLLCGPLVGGLLYDRYGRRTTFRLAAAAVLLNAAAQIALVLLVPPSEHDQKAAVETTKEDEKEKKKPGLKDSLGVLIANRDVRVLALSTAAVHGALGVLKPLSQVVMQREFNMGVSKRSFIISIATATYLVITPIAGRVSDDMSKATLITTSLILMTLSTIFFMFRHLGLWAVNICVGLAGASLAFAGSVAQALMADLVDRNRLGDYGMAFALSDMSDSLGLILGPIVGLAASQYFGPSVGIGIMGLFCLVLTPFVMQIPP